MGILRVLASGFVTASLVVLLALAALVVPETALADTGTDCASSCSATCTDSTCLFNCIADCCYTKCAGDASCRSTCCTSACGTDTTCLAACKVGDCYSTTACDPNRTCLNLADCKMSGKCDRTKLGCEKCVCRSVQQSCVCQFSAIKE